MDALEAIKSRRSVRKYLEKSIPVDILEDIVDCGRLAPSGHNQQTWVFVVVTDNQTRERIAGITKYGKFIKEAGACIAVFCKKDSATPLEDACAATENMIIAAQAHGLGTCWVNSHRKEHSEQLKILLKCPEDMELMVLLAVGYPEAQPEPKQKKKLGEVLKWNKF